MIHFETGPLMRNKVQIMWHKISHFQIHNIKEMLNACKEYKKETK